MENNNFFFDLTNCRVLFVKKKKKRLYEGENETLTNEFP